MSSSEENKSPTNIKVSVWPPITAAVIIFAAGFFVGHAIPNYGYQLPLLSLIQPQPGGNVQPISNPTPTLSPLMCKHVTYPTNTASPIKDEFFQKYTAKPGDTLFSIAKSQLGDVSRVNELVNLNKTQYPTLSV